MRSLVVGGSFLVLALSVAAAPRVFEVGPGRPLASLEAARDAVRAARAAGELPEGAVVRVAAGLYPLERTLTLDARDAGTAAAPVRWEAQPGAVLSGGRTVTAAPLTDAALLARLPAAVRGQVRVIDLRAQGIADFGRIAQRGNPGLELFFRGRRQPLAAYPNEGWLLIADVPQTGAKRFNEGLAREKRFDGVPAGRHYGRIAYDGDRPSHWSADNEIYAHGYWTWDWSDTYQRVQAIDAAKREVTFAEPHHSYGYTKHQRYRFLNVLEELDAPGEWVLDRARGLIYFLPPAEPRGGDLVVSLLETPLVHLDGASHVVFAGFTLETSRGTGVLVSGGEDCTLAGLTLRNLGGEAVTIDGGRRHTVQSCDFFELANGAVRVTGGDRRTLEPSGHRVLNNHIHHASQWLRTGQYGVMIDGVGHRVAHNLVHDLPFEAFYLRGNDHVLEFNEVHRVCLETGDAGGIHTGRDYTWRGNVIRYNYWHDLKGPGLHGVTAVYLDDFSSGFTVHGNIFYRAGRGVQVGGGRDNRVTNNLFVECQPAVHLDARGLGWASNYFNGEYPWLFDRFREIGGDRPPYATRYPALVTLLADQPAVPKGNVFRANLSWGGRWMDVYDYWAFDFHGVTTLRDNWIADAAFIRRRAQKEDFWDPYYLNIDGEAGYRTWRRDEPETQREFAGNRLAAEAPGTFDPRTLRFTPRDAAALQALGFEPIPVEQIGLQVDAWRKTVPERVP